ncbi:MAG: hypothetical protein HFK07_06280 [Clostridia bacterium]|jgi:hypothetical protein|nr:hypothetical protein [Clostridia bacterium]
MSNFLSKRSRTLLCVLFLVIAVVISSLIVAFSQVTFSNAEEVKKYVLTEEGKYNINDANAIVDFSGAGELTDMTFSIGSNVKLIKFIGGGTLKKSFKNISVNVRNTELRMTLENVHIFGGYNNSGIYASWCPKLILEVIGSNSISAGTVTSIIGAYSGGISCQNIDIIGSGSISIEGAMFNLESTSEHKSDVNGLKGQPGLYISRADCVVNISAKSVNFIGGNAGLAKNGEDQTKIPAAPKKATTGKQATPGTEGIKGENGGNGGNGGAGIYSSLGTATVNISAGSQVSFVGGNGSDGADGGKGGKGGTGGEGADGEPLRYGTVGGKGGKGGEGGDGGYAGLGGQPFENCKIVGEYTATVGKAGRTGGRGGAGGDGGAGGLGGWRLDKKFRWASGSQGDKGDSGVDRRIS